MLSPFRRRVDMTLVNASRSFSTTSIRGIGHHPVAIDFLAFPEAATQFAQMVSTNPKSRRWDDDVCVTSSNCFMSELGIESWARRDWLASRGYSLFWEECLEEVSILEAGNKGKCKPNFFQG